MQRRVFLLFLASLAIAIAACNAGGVAPAAAPVRPPVQPGSPYHHIIVVIQENRSFDNMFAGAVSQHLMTPNVETTMSGYNNTCGNPNVVTTCTPVPLAQNGFENTFDPNHSYASLVAECNMASPTPVPTGNTSPCRMNGFATAPGDGNTTYSYLTPGEIMPYVRLANAYGIADHFFSPGLSPSFPGHVFLVSSLGPADDPIDPSGAAWGCYEPRTDTALLFNGQAPWPCYNLPSISTQLDAKRISWKYYTGEGENPPTGWDGLVVSFAAIASVFDSPQYQQKVVPRANFFKDVQTNGKCTLPAMSWITPNGNASDHAGFDTSADGPYWVATLYEAVAQSPCYADTAMLVLWDDAGGWYDHVAPPFVLTPPPPAFMGYRSNVVGARVPLLFIAPNAVATVSKTPRDFGAVLAFVERNFGLMPLGGEDLDFNGDALADMWQAHPAATITPIPISQMASRGKRIYSVQYFLSRPEMPADDQ